MNASQHLLNKLGNNICVNSTHGLSRYYFEFSILTVIDEYGKGFPCAYMFTNQKGTFILKSFFIKIKKLLQF